MPPPLAGLESLTLRARQLRGRNITINAVTLGPTETQMLRADLANSRDDEQR